MTDSEDLQAQVDALRLLVQSLLACAPLEVIRKDVAIRFEAWEDMHIPNEVSERYLDLMRNQHVMALSMLDTLMDQRASDGRTG